MCLGKRGGDGIRGKWLDLRHFEGRTNRIRILCRWGHCGKKKIIRAIFYIFGFSNWGNSHITSFSDMQKTGGGLGVLLGEVGVRDQGFHNGKERVGYMNMELWALGEVITWENAFGCHQQKSNI